MHRLTPNPAKACLARWGVAPSVPQEGPEIRIVFGHVIVGESLNL